MTMSNRRNVLHWKMVRKIFSSTACSPLFTVALIVVDGFYFISGISPLSGNSVVLI